MSDELREKIYKACLRATYEEDAKLLTDAILALISTSSLSQPSGVEAVRKCDKCSGKPRERIKVEAGHYEDFYCSACHGTGEIVRELTVVEVVADYIATVKEHKVSCGLDWPLSYPIGKAGERVRVKEDI